MRTETSIERCAGLSHADRRGIVGLYSCLAYLALFLGLPGLQAGSGA